MKKLNLNIVAVLVALIAIVGLVKGQLILFLGFLFLSGMILGSNRMIKLEEDENPEKSIKRSNFRLALIGVGFGILAGSGIEVVDVLASFAFGVSFGLIAVNFIFEKSRG